MTGLLMSDDRLKGFTEILITTLDLATLVSLLYTAKNEIGRLSLPLWYNKCMLRRLYHVG